MVNPNRFYTYAYLRVDRTPYYIGKGQRKRIYQRGGKPCGVPKDKSRIIFLKQNLTEEEAFKHEKYMITVLGRKDLGTGILHNKTNGGEGSSGAVRSEEHKRKIREGNKGKKLSEETKRKLSEINKGKSLSEETKTKLSENWKGENNPNYGRTHSEETRKVMSEKKKDRKWWNDGKGNNKLSIECPGEGWVPGMMKKKKRT